MDDEQNPKRQLGAAQGGVVEPARRATVSGERLQTEKRDGEHYEMRDPFAEVTYRADTLSEMLSKAERIGSSRIVAVADDGKRTPILKAGGEWQRGAQLPAASERPLDATPARDEVTETVTATPMAGSAAGRLQSQRSNSPSEARDERIARVAGIESALMDRYLIKRAPVAIGDVRFGLTEYRFRGDSSRVAFTESTFRLATDTNSPSVARSMIDVAEARNWTSLRVSGHEDFKRMVWLEASLRGRKTLGYEPNPGDLELLKREREARLVNRIEPNPSEHGTTTNTTPAEKASTRGGGGRKAVLAAIEAVLVARKVPEQQRAAVMAAAAEKLAQRLGNGQAPKVKLYDKAAPTQRPEQMQAQQQHRSRERVHPAPTR